MAGVKKMAFCRDCGKYLMEGSKFCSHCGKQQDVEQSNNAFERKQEWGGKIIKCPSCGTDLPSFTAICPGCGHEINSAQVTRSVKEFSNGIEECDIHIANSPEVSKGWSSWNKGTRIWWVVLNYFFCCLPLIIYFLWKPIKSVLTLSLTIEEKEKVAFIENYPSANDRESILDLLLFIKSKTFFLYNEKVTANTAYWARVWVNKAKQVYNKSEILLKGDTIANNAYNEILTFQVQVEKKLRNRAIINLVVKPLVIIIIFALLIVFSDTDEFDKIVESEKTTVSSSVVTTGQMKNHHTSESGSEHEVEL